MQEPTGITRRDMVVGGVAVAAAAAIPASPAASRTEKFDITRSFAAFMKDIGGAIGDAGGKVTFTGSDPIIRSHFRVGAAMAIPAMGPGWAQPPSGGSVRAKART